MGALMDELSGQQIRAKLEEGLTKLQARTSRRPHVGCSVLYVMSSGHSKGEDRPAIIVRDWNNPNTLGMVNLQVFTDFLNDYPAGVPGSDGRLWATSVHYSEDKEPGTWHWPERV